jgi:hypothetical protein
LFYIPSSAILCSIPCPLRPSFLSLPPSSLNRDPPPFKLALTRFVYRFLNTDHPCASAANAFSRPIEEVDSMECALISSAIRERRTAHPPGFYTEAQVSGLPSRVMSTMSARSIVPTPCLPPPTTTMRACTCQRDGRGIHIPVLRSRSASYDDGQWEYDERGHGGMRERVWKEEWRGCGRQRKTEKSGGTGCSEGLSPFFLCSFLGSIPCGGSRSR